MTKYTLIDVYGGSSETSVNIYPNIWHFFQKAVSLTIQLLGIRPPLWYIDRSPWIQIQRSRVGFPALPDFLRSSGSGTGFTQPREDN
jgi:hypothetical protein